MAGGVAPAILNLTRFERRKVMSNAQSIFQSMPVPKDATTEQRKSMQQMQEMTNEQMDQSLWAAAQGLALNKLKLFHTMAKQVNDQQ